METSVEHQTQVQDGRDLDDGVTNGQDLKLQEHAEPQEEELNRQSAQDQPQNREQSPEANSIGISSSSSLLRGRVYSGERGSGETSMRDHRVLLGTINTPVSYMRLWRTCQRQCSTIKGSTRRVLPSRSGSVPPYHRQYFPLKFTHHRPGHHMRKKETPFHLWGSTN